MYIWYGFEPYRRRPCGVTWDVAPNSRGNKAAANRRPSVARSNRAVRCSV